MKLAVLARGFGVDQPTEIGDEGVRHRDSFGGALARGAAPAIKEVGFDGLVLRGNPASDAAQQAVKDASPRTVRRGWTVHERASLGRTEGGGSGREGVGGRTLRAAQRETLNLGDSKLIKP